jgi:hypothetical protein
MFPECCTHRRTSGQVAGYCPLDGFHLIRFSDNVKSWEFIDADEDPNNVLRWGPPIGSASAANEGLTAPNEGPKGPNEGLKEPNEGPKERQCKEGGAGGSVKNASTLATPCGQKGDPNRGPPAPQVKGMEKRAPVG